MSSGHDAPPKLRRLTSNFPGTLMDSIWERSLRNGPARTKCPLLRSPQQDRHPSVWEEILLFKNRERPRTGTLTWLLVASKLEELGQICPPGRTTLP